MSVPRNGRYRSRLFNLMNRQSRRWIVRGNRALRHLKVTVVWGVQILLYPIYLFVQGTLYGGRQLLSEAEAGWPRLKALVQLPTQPIFLNSDHTIRQILKDIKIIPLPATSGLVSSPLTLVVVVQNEWSLDKTEINPKHINASLSTLDNKLTPSTPGLMNPINPDETGAIHSQSWAIQGVATLLTKRTLVLITTENRILDILTPQQQNKLAARITWELANFHRQQRLMNPSKLKRTQRRLNTFDHPPLVLPLRLFWRVMAWLQTSPVAITMNIFGESTVIQPSSDTPENPHPTSSKPSPSNPPLAVLLSDPLTVLDRTVAVVESHPLMQNFSVVRFFGKSLQKYQLIPPPSSLASANSEALIEDAEPPKFWLQGLIDAAFNYFFGQQNSTLSENDRPNQDPRLRTSIDQSPQLYGDQSHVLPPFNPSPPQPLTGVIQPDPWLTWDDLFTPLDVPPQQPNFTVFKEKNLTSSTLLPEGFNPHTPIPPEQGIWAVLKRYLNHLQRPGTITVPLTPLSTNPTLQAKTPEVNLNTIPLTVSDRLPKITLTDSSKTENLAQTKPANTTTLKQPIPTNNQTINPKSVPLLESSNLHSTPDWIEIEATPTGYVKHPLEQLLEWLDIGMLWLEELAIKLWRWLRQWWRKLNKIKD